MNHNDEFIQNLATLLPNPCSVRDLIKFGIYNTPQAASQSRERGDCPTFFQLGRRVFYPKAAVIQWMKDHSYGKRPSDKIA